MRRVSPILTGFFFTWRSRIKLELYSMREFPRIAGESMRNAETITLDVTRKKKGDF